MLVLAACHHTPSPHAPALSHHVAPPVALPPVEAPAEPDVAIDTADDIALILSSVERDASWTCVWSLWHDALWSAFPATLDYDGDPKTSGPDDETDVADVMIDADHHLLASVATGHSTSVTSPVFYCFTAECEKRVPLADEPDRNALRLADVVAHAALPRRARRDRARVSQAA